jgi:hypothetical protein
VQSRTALILVSCNIRFAPILVQLGTAPISMSLIQSIASVPILVQLLIKLAPILVQLLV